MKWKKPILGFWENNLTDKSQKDDLPSCFWTMAYKIVMPGIAEKASPTCWEWQNRNWKQPGSFLKLYIAGPILELSTSYFLFSNINILFYNHSGILTAVAESSWYLSLKLMFSKGQVCIRQMVYNEIHWEGTNLHYSIHYWL